MKIDVDYEFTKILTSIDNLIDDCQMNSYDREYNKLSKLYRIVNHMYEIYPTDSYWSSDDDTDSEMYIEDCGDLDEEQY